MTVDYNVGSAPILGTEKAPRSHSGHPKARFLDRGLSFRDPRTWDPLGEMLTGRSGCVGYMATWTLQRLHVNMPHWVPAPRVTWLHGSMALKQLGAHTRGPADTFVSIHVYKYIYIYISTSGKRAKGLTNYGYDWER